MTQFESKIKLTHQMNIIIYEQFLPEFFGEGKQLLWLNFQKKRT